MYPFNVGYQQGTSFILSYRLSSSPQKCNSEIDNVIPATFQLLSTPQDVLNQVLTSRNAKSVGIKVPNLRL